MAFSRFPVRFGKYIVLDRISVGGMAEVYRAKEADDEFCRVIAIKCMRDSVATDQSMVPMFVDEAKLASRLVHPNIAQIYELGRTDGALYIAMELINGHDLKTIARDGQKKRLPLPPALACYVVTKAAEALDYAHTAAGPDGRPMRLVHRDVSPQNLMLDHDGEVKVIDFGIAKADARLNKTVAGTIKGKFSYMAPEQIASKSVDSRADIFALGIVLYELLSGERLYDGSSMFSIYDKVVNHPAPRVSDSADVHPELDEVVSQCLQQDPEARYQTAGQLVDALSKFRIKDRTIVGSREARDFMQKLYPDELLQWRASLKRYQAVTELDCVDPSREVDPAEMRKTQVFVSQELPLPAVSAPESREDRTRVLAPPLIEETVKERALRATETVDQDTLDEEKSSFNWTLCIIAAIAVIAAVIIAVARARDVTAMELLEHPLGAQHQK